MFEAPVARWFYSHQCFHLNFFNHVTKCVFPYKYVHKPWLARVPRNGCHWKKVKKCPSRMLPSVVCNKNSNMTSVSSLRNWIDRYSFITIPPERVFCVYIAIFVFLYFQISVLFSTSKAQIFPIKEENSTQK